ETLALTLRGEYSDGTQKEIKDGAEWVSSNSRVAIADAASSETSGPTSSTRSVGAKGRRGVGGHVDAGNRPTEAQDCSIYYQGQGLSSPRKLCGSAGGSGEGAPHRSFERGDCRRDRPDQEGL